MAVYHQMGHHSENLIPEITGYSGAILSPLNANAERMRSVVSGHSDIDFEFVFDPQLYFPTTEREHLRAWPYFPNDVETADLADLGWWSSLSADIVKVCRELDIGTVCSPAIVPNAFDASFYRSMVDIAAGTAEHAGDIEVLQTVVVHLPDLASQQRVMEIASAASSTVVDRLYLIFLVNEAPRRELTESTWLTGALRLISELRNADFETIIGFCGPEAILYTAAGASCCATGKFFNLRRFTPGRFDEPSAGGGQLPYWFEESLLAYLREADLVRVQAAAELSAASLASPYGQGIIAQIAQAPGTAWLARSWQHYMHWFADVDRRLRRGDVTTEQLLLTAEQTWARIDDSGLLMEEPRNDGRWVRPWRIALREYGQDRPAPGDSG